MSRKIKQKYKNILAQSQLNDTNTNPKTFHFPQSSNTFQQVLFGDTESGVRRPLNSVDEEESD